LEEADIPNQAARKIVDRINKFLQTFENDPLPAQAKSNSEPNHFSG
jgi:hypothetical protein